MKRLFFALLLLITFTSFPYIGNYAFGSLYVIVSAALILLSAVLIIDYSKNLELKPKDKDWFRVWTIYLCAVVIYALLMSLREESFYDFRRAIGLSVKILFVYVAFIIIIKHNDFIKIYLKSNYLIAILSILLFFLWTGGLNLPYFLFTKIDGRLHHFFFIGASNSVLNWEGVQTMRIAGFADEPGAFALMLNYFLITNELTLKKNKYRIFFSIAGVLSFSLAFYLTYIFFLFYWFVANVISLKKLVTISIMVSLLVIVYNAFFNIEGFSIITETFLARFEMDSSSGFIKGDNRSDSFGLQWQAFKNNIFLGIGDNLEIKSKYELYNPSIIGFLANYGLYGFVFFLMPVYAIIIKYFRKKEFILILVLLISYMQRPGIEDMFSMLSLSIIYFYSYNRYD
jgi:hypothetical protein